MCVPLAEAIGDLHLSRVPNNFFNFSEKLVFSRSFVSVGSANYFGWIGEGSDS